ncbi:MAG: ABC transporter substrate-binding protein [Bacillota bacterium]
MKRFLVFLLVTILAVVAAVPASAARPESKYRVTFNGRLVAFDSQPTVIDGTTFVPFRAIFEKMGASITWDGATQTITAERDGTTISLSIGSTTAYVNGQARTLRAAPYIDPQFNRTLVPLRFVGEAFGAQVNYDPVTTAISIVDSNWPKRGGTLNLALWNKPEGDFNPITSSDTYSSNIMGLMYSNLWRLDEQLLPQPDLAEAWEWSENNTKLTFYLRKDIKFFDGTPITAHDVVFTYKAIAHPRYIGPRNTGFDKILGWNDYNKGLKGENAANFENGFVTTEGIEGLYAEDDHTVVFKLSEPDAPFFINQILYAPVDSKRYANVPVQDWGTPRDPNNAYPNGNGMYKMEQYVEGQYAILVKNDLYHNGVPYIDKIVYRVVDPNVAVGEMQKGTLDFAEFSAPELTAYQEISHVNIHEYPDFVYQMMVYNTQREPFNDVRVRQAFNYAIDRRAIIDNLLEGHASTIYAPIHPLTWAYTEDGVEKYEYNPEKAKQLLDEAGWVVGADGIREKNGKKLSVELMYPNVGNLVRQRTAPVVQQWLQAIGVDIKIGGYDWGTLLQKTFTDFDYDLFFIGFSLALDPDPTGIWDKASYVPDGFNASGWWTDYSEELLQKGRATLDIGERMEIYAEWQRHWAEESPAIIFYAPNTFVAANKRLQGFKPGPQGALWNLDDLWLSN